MRLTAPFILLAMFAVAAFAADGSLAGQPGPNNPSQTQDNCANQTPKPPSPYPPSGGSSTGPTPHDHGNLSGDGQSGSLCQTCDSSSSSSTAKGSGRTDSAYGSSFTAQLTSAMGGTQKTCQPTAHVTGQDSGNGGNPDLTGGQPPSNTPPPDGDGNGNGSTGGPVAGNSATACSSCGGSGGFPGRLPGPLEQPTMGLPEMYRHLYTKDSQGLQSLGDQSMNWDLRVTTTWNDQFHFAVFTYFPPNASIPLDFRTTDGVSFTLLPHNGRTVAARCERTRDGDDLEITSEFGDTITVPISGTIDLTIPHRLPARQLHLRTGATFMLTYDDDRLIGVQGPLGSISYTWTEFNYTRVVGSMTGADGRTTTYEYADHGGMPSLHRVTHPDGSEDTFTYDDTPVYLPNYDPPNRRMFVHWSNYLRDRSRDLTYYLEPRLGLVVLVTDAMGRRVYDRAANGIVDGQVWRYIIDQHGRGQIFWYDGNAVLSRIQDAVTGMDEVFTGDGLDHVTGRQDELGRRWSYAYQSDSFLPIATTYPDGSSDASALQPGTHEETSRTDRLSHVTATERNAQGLPADITYADGAHEHTDYNAIGQAVRHVDALGRETLNFYAMDGVPADAPSAWDDPANQGWLVAMRLPQDVTEASAPTWLYTWDVAAGDLTTTTDPTGRVFRFTYDLMHRTTSCTYADGTSDVVEYGAPGTQDVGLVVARTDRDGRRTTFEYDASGLEIRQTLADGGLITKTYDEFGRLASRTTFGDTEDYTYDAAARLVAVTRHPNASTSLTATTTYDSHDRRIAQTDPYGRSAFTVPDVNDRPVRRVQELVPGAAGKATFDAAFADTALATAGWSDQDIGVTQPGSGSIGGDTATVVGGGADIWGTADAFNFLSQPLAGDGSIVAEVDSQQVTDPWCKAGVMIRESSAPDARYAMLALTTGGVAFQSRSVAGQETSFEWGELQASAPVYLRLVQKDRRVHAYVGGFGGSGGADGEWREVASIEMSITAQSRIGLCVTSHNPDALSGVLFIGVAVEKTSVSPIVATAAWQAHLLALGRTNPDLVVTDTAYLANGLVASTMDGRGIISSYAYDLRDRQIGQTVAVATPDEASTSTVYDAVGNPTSVTDPRRLVTTMTYTARDRVATRRVAVDTADEAGIGMTYTFTDHIASRTDELGFTTHYLYCDCCDRLEDIIDPLGFDTHIEYDGVGNRTSVTDGNGLTTVMTYDARNRRLTSTNAAVELTTWAYVDDASVLPGAAGLGFGLGADGSAVVVTDPLNEIQIDIRDGLGRTVRRIDALGHHRDVVYDQLVVEDGRTLVATMSTDAIGDSNVVHADGLGRSVSRTDGLGKISHMTYDADGNVVSTLDANRVGQVSVFDLRNRRRLSTDTAGSTTTWTYDLDSNVLTQTDALLAVTSMTYDARNRKTSTTDRISATTQFAYDAVGNLTVITDAEGGTTTYGYDERSLLVSETFPAPTGGARSYLYDGGRRLVQRLDQLGVATIYAYDRANRLIARSYSSAFGAIDSFGYDQAGRLLLAESGRYHDQVARVYDAAGRLTGESLVLDGTTFPVGYDYDDADRLTGITYPSGERVKRSYDARDQLGEVDFADALVAKRSYDDGGRLLETDFVNGVVERRAYIPGDNLVASLDARDPAAGAVVTAFSYHYDGDKRKLDEGDGALPNAPQDFGYDAEGRLTSWDRGAADSQSWNLSPVGDWISTMRDGVTQNRTHTPVHEISSIDGQPALSDPKGNLSLQLSPFQILAWDDENRLTSAAGSGPAGLFAARYRYDALGRRIQKTVNGLITTWVNSGAQEIIELVGDPAKATWIEPHADLSPPVTGVGPKGSLLQQPGTLHIDFRPDATGAETGWQADTGALFAAHGDLAYGWDRTRNAVDRAYLDQPEWDTFVRMMPGANAGTWSIALEDGSYPVVVVMGDATSRNQTNTITVAGTEIDDPTPAETGPNGYEQGAFDGYTTQATVAGGRLTVAPILGVAKDPKICFIEIGPKGGVIDDATRDRVAQAVSTMNGATATKRGKNAVARERVYGSYVDEPLALVHGSERFYYNANHLYSVAALTDASGAPVERYRYDAYGNRTILDGAGTSVRSASSYGNQVGLTGRYHDGETGLVYFRARMYSPTLGRFVGRDPKEYPNGYNLYHAPFVPRFVDPTGKCTDECTTVGERKNEHVTGLEFTPLEQQTDPDGVLDLLEAVERIEHLEHLEELASIDLAINGGPEAEWGEAAGEALAALFNHIRNPNPGDVAEKAAHVLDVTMQNQFAIWVKTSWEECAERRCGCLWLSKEKYWDTSDHSEWHRDGNDGFGWNTHDLLKGVLHAIAGAIGGGAHGK